jgi:creatinine amidohydrolase/Fe(II)-dependent formamide hydrolase-like protein
MRSGRHKLYPPSLFVSVELCERLYTEILENLAELGFRLCVAFGGHGPAASLLKRLAERLGGQMGGMKILTCGSATYIRDLLPGLDPEDPSPGAHGGLWETAMNMGLNREFVDLTRVRSINASPIPSQLKGRGDKQFNAIERATPEMGERLLDTAALRLAEQVKALLHK